jgi:hypothetical protein
LCQFVNVNVGSFATTKPERLPARSANALLHRGLGLEIGVDTKCDCQNLYDSPRDRSSFWALCLLKADLVQALSGKIFSHKIAPEFVLGETAR